MPGFNLNQSGMTILEVTVAAALGTVVVLALSSSMKYGAMAMRGVVNSRALSEFENQLNLTVRDPSLCMNVIQGAINPELTTPQGISLNVPLRPNTNVNSTIGNGLKIASISFIKQADAYTDINNSDNHSYTSYGVEYRPLFGTVTVGISNTDVLSKSAFGAPKTTVSVPVSLTFKNNGNSNWGVSYCQAQVPSLINNTGWQNGPNYMSNSNFCSEEIPVASGNPALCPKGMYVMGQAQRMVTKTTTTYKADCKCSGSCKGCVCVVGSGCHNVCDSSGNSTIDADSCMGTCDSHASCTAVTTTTKTPTLFVRCCNVQR